MPSFVFNTAKRKLFEDALNLNNDQFRVHLVTAQPNADANVAGDLAAVEYTDPSYSPQNLPNKIISYDADTNTVSMVAEDVTFAALDGDGTTSIVGMVISRIDADPAQQHLVCFNQFTQPYLPNGADLTVEIPLAGILKAQ